MEKNDDIEISILKGDKLFNKNTPFVINLISHQQDENEKKCNADLICVIDISGSMYGPKIEQVKQSLKILIELMDEKERICLILFDDRAEIFYELNYLTKPNKEILNKKIDKIQIGGGTNILSGLEKAINVLKRIRNNDNSVSSILLLSDGCDNFSNDVQLADSLKKLTKGLGLSFTLNTFGYGDDHDAKTMNKLANLRDGSFFYVQDYSKITEYFVSILGGCLSVISKEVELNLQVLNNNCQIMKVYGEDSLYYHQSDKKSFKTTMLQFISDKEYTFVLELFVDESKIKVDDEIVKVCINYEDISHNNEKRKIEKKYKYQLEDLENSKANQEYIRAYVYYNLDLAKQKKDQGQTKEGKKLLEDLENWLISNNKGNNKVLTTENFREYIEDIKNAKGLFSDDDYIRIKSYNNVSCTVQEKTSKRIGTTLTNCNRFTKNMLSSIPRQMPITQPISHNYQNNYENKYKKIIPVQRNAIHEKHINNIPKNKSPKDSNSHINKTQNNNRLNNPKNNYNNNTVYHKRNIMNLSYRNNIKQAKNLNQKNNTFYNPNNNNNNYNNNTYNREKVPMDSIRRLNQSHVFVSSKNNIDNTIKSRGNDDIMRFMNKYKKSNDNNKKSNNNNIFD